MVTTEVSKHWKNYVKGSKKTYFLEDGVKIDQKLGEYLRSYTRFIIGHIRVENGSGEFIAAIKGCEHVEECALGDTARIRVNALCRSIDAIVNVLDVGGLECLSSQNGLHNLDDVAFAETSAIEGEDIGSELGEEEIAKTRENAQRKKLSAMNRWWLEKGWIVGDGKDHQEMVFHQTL